MAYRSYSRLDGQQLPRNHKPDDCCVLCGGPEAEGYWLEWNSTTGELTCSDCR